MQKRLALIIVLAVAVLAGSGFSGCAPPPPNLSPAASAAFTNQRVQKALDIIRDTARDAAAQTPPVIPQATANKVNDWHEAAIKVIHATGSGWQPTVTTSLDELLKNLTPPEQALIGPYVTLAKTLIAQVTT